MGYIVRNKDGILLAEINNVVAQKIMAETRGVFRAYKNDPEITVYELLTSILYGLNGFKVYIPKNSILIPE
jgi:hypothetical protein